jgi:hypothetical protein
MLCRVLSYFLPMLPRPTINFIGHEFTNYCEFYESTNLIIEELFVFGY